MNSAHGRQTAADPPEPVRASLPPTGVVLAEPPTSRAIIGSCPVLIRRSTNPAALRGDSGRFGYWDMSLVGAVAILAVLVHPVHAMVTRRTGWMTHGLRLFKAPLLSVPRLERDHARRVRGAVEARSWLGTATRTAGGAGIYRTVRGDGLLRDRPRSSLEVDRGCSRCGSTRPGWLSRSFPCRIAPISSSTPAMRSSRWSCCLPRPR